MTTGVVIYLVGGAGKRGTCGNDDEIGVFGVGRFLPMDLVLTTYLV